MPKKNHIRSPQEIWENISTTLVNFVERIFFTLGVVVARHPWRTITLSWTFVLLSCFGLMRFHIEKNPMKLWVPPESDFFRDTDWYIEKFGTGFRFQRVLITADNVLDASVLTAIQNITDEINSIEITYRNETYSLKDLCFQVPIVKYFAVTENSNSSHKTESYVDDTLWVDDDFYCGFIEGFTHTCLQYNLLDLWKKEVNDVPDFSNISSNDIIQKVNKVKTNPVTGHPFDYTTLLGGVKLDTSGDIVSANSIILTWFTEVNMTEINMDDVGNLVGTEDWVSVHLSLWEQEFLDIMAAISHKLPGLKVFYESGRSFSDISGNTIMHDLDKLFIGIALMFVYIIFGLSRCNWLEIKLTLGGVGLLCVGMAYISAICWCSIMGIPFGPVHSSLPFLLMGLGIDDMFVMKACWEKLSDKEREKPLPVKIGLMLQHAGVSIVITSFTDVVALLIGAITILPSLKSFCIYAALGVFFIFCFSVTYYVAVFTLDIRRMESNRNGLLFCIAHKRKIQLSTDKTCFQKFLSHVYQNIIFTIPAKIAVILFTLIMTGFSIDAIFRLEQRFDPKWFIPTDTYYKNFLDTHQHYYPNEGNQAFLFFGKFDYNNESEVLYNMTQKLRREPYVNDLSTWIESFRGYIETNYNRHITNITDDEFNTYLSRFLFSPIGAKYQINFKFSPPLRCGHPAPEILATTMSFFFPRFAGPEQYLPAMNKIKDLVHSTNITTGDGYRSVWSKVFANWVTDEIIGVEVERNLELALLCVMACTVILITNLQMCLWIFICVLLTIINVLGWMQRWGMTVDIVCCIGLELAIGLCVDYAAHVGHTFLTIPGSCRTERAYKTVTSIGTAVLLGGGSTFLSLLLLSVSKAYTFQSFFKIFFLVILFGLFHGLVFLPVVLSLIGPLAYRFKEVELAAEMVELNGKTDGKEKQIDDS